MKIKRVYDWSDFVEFFHEKVTCPILGHDWKRKMWGYVCGRCTVYVDGSVGSMRQ